MNDSIAYIPSYFEINITNLRSGVDKFRVSMSYYMYIIKFYPCSYTYLELKTFIYPLYTLKGSRICNY